MHGELRDGVVALGGDARQRFYDSRGYGRPLDGNALELAPVEAAHLLQRGDLEGVSGMDFREFLVETGTTLAFVVYRDLRERGFYLSPAREGWVDADAPDDADAPGDDSAEAPVDFVVYPRGKGPWDDAVEYRIRVTGERQSIPVGTLSPSVLAVVDEDGELTYYDVVAEKPGGDVEYDPPGGLDATLVDDRVLVWNPPEALYERGFYGQRLYGRNAAEGPLQLSLVEATHLARAGRLSLSPSPVVDRGRAVEGERFDRRLRVYTALREAGTVPKSGFKFGADFRTYDSFTTVSELRHSEYLVRVVDDGHTFVPRDLSLDVRLAGSVRKRMVFAVTDANGGIDWLSVARLTP